MTALATLWLSSLAVAGFGTWVLFDASIGLNWSLWMTLAAASLGLSAWLGAGRVSAPLAATLALACALGTGAALTADPVFHATPTNPAGNAFGTHLKQKSQWIVCSFSGQRNDRAPLFS